MPATRQQTALTLVGTLLAIFLAALDQTVVATAGPAIQRALHVETAMYSWITTAYLVASTVMVPVYGRLSDVWGRKPVILVGIGVFLAGSLWCGLAETTLQLILFRGLQGAGAAGVFTTSFAVVGDLFPPLERGRYAGLLGGVFGVASLLGPLLGGLITDAVDWHWVFLINLPFGALALGFIWLRMPVVAKAPGRHEVDGLGAVLLAVGLVPLLVAASLGRSVLREGDPGYLWVSPQMGALGLAAVVGLCAFVLWERRAPVPLMDFSLFRDRTFAAGNLAAFFLGGVFLTPMVFLPLFMVNVVGVTHTASGLTITPLVLGVVFGNLLSGQAVSRLGRYRPLMVVAVALMLAGLAVMAFTLSAASTQSELTLKMVLLGVGLGPALPLYTLAVQNAVGQEHLGVATSITAFARLMGSTLGVALVGSVFASTLSAQLTERLQQVAQGLPAQVAARLTAGRSADDEDPAGPAFDAARLRQKAADQLDAARAVAVRALGGERLAAALVERSAFADDALKAAVADGGLPAQVHAQFEALRARAEAEGVAVLASDRATPEGLQVRLAPGAGPVAWAEAEREERERRLNEATAALDRTVAAARDTLNRALDETERAFKEAFAEASRAVYRLAMVFAVLALAATLVMPEGPLRRSGAPQLGR